MFNIKDETVLTVSQQSFLGNSSNKAGLIKLMSPKLTADGHTVKQAVSDADTLIIESVLEIASEGKSVRVFL